MVHHLKYMPDLNHALPNARFPPAESPARMIFLGTISIFDT